MSFFSVESVNLHLGYTCNGTSTNSVVLQSLSITMVWVFSTLIFIIIQVEIRLLILLTVS